MSERKFVAKVEGPLSVLGHRWQRRNGMKQDPRPESTQQIVAQRNHYRRALQALTKGLPKLERAGEVCGRMNWACPEEAIRYARNDTFGGLYDGLPLCEIEQAMAVKSHNLLIVLCAYAVVAPVIQRQLGALLAEKRNGPEGIGPQ